MKNIFPFLIGVTVTGIGYCIERTALKYFNPSYEFYWLLIGIIVSVGILTFVQFKNALSFNWKSIFIWSIVLRISILFISPNLSDDYYRFIWDGRLSSIGENPFLTLPSEFIESEKAVQLDVAGEVYEGFNSHHYYSVYPPINQSIYWVAATFGGHNPYYEALIMRLFILLGEIGSVWLILQLLKSSNLPIKYAVWYAWNPVIILEFVGNLHFEGLMLFFMLLGLYLLQYKRYHLGALAWGASICIKLLPLMFLPLFLKYLGVKKSIQFYSITLLFFIATYIPFWDANLIPNIQSSIELYFGTFEFNAGIIYFIRWMGFQSVGYDITYKVMPIVAKLIVLFIVLFGLMYNPKKITDLIKAILLCAFIYLSLGAIVHPWYVAMLVPFAAISNWKFPLAWSFLVILSYAAYQNSEYQENYFLIAIEYLAVLGLIGVELYQFYKRPNSKLISH